MDFPSKINQFQTIGTYDYKFDEVGNVIVNSSSTTFQYNYLCLPLMDVVYDPKSIESYYNVQFEEFLPAPESNEVPDDLPIMDFEELESVKAENEELKTRLDDLVLESEDNSTEAERQATKDVILELRKALGEGVEDRDFSEEFPYTAKTVE